MLNNSLSQNITDIDKAICRDGAFDIKLARLIISGRDAAYYYIDGYVDSKSIQTVHLWLQHASLPENYTIDSLSQNAVAFGEQKEVETVDEICLEILQGNMVLLIEGLQKALTLNVYNFPKRSIEETEKNRTLRGPHDSFSESLLSNTVLIRRRIASKKLRLEKFTFGTNTNTRVALCYMDGIADKKSVESIRNKLSKIDVNSLTLCQETIATELLRLSRSHLYNPLPKVRYIERPDTAASMIIEGKILILCDNSPSIIALPINIFDFFEEQNDYYFPPFTGSYLRFVRLIVFISSVFLIPIWMLIASGDIFGTLSFLNIDEKFSVPIFIQFLIIEIAIDGLKLASINTPNSMSNSLSVVGGLLLGDFAVKSGWFIPQTILYSAFTAIANFVPLNYELGYSFKFSRIFLIILVEIFGLWGLIVGTLLLTVILAFTKTIDGSSYLYPFIPFSLKGLRKILFMSTGGREGNKKDF